MQLRPQTFYMDGEGVVCGDDGVAIFDELHGKANDHAAAAKSLLARAITREAPAGVVLGVNVPRANALGANVLKDNSSAKLDPRGSINEG
jgi:hypothetical protein